MARRSLVVVLALLGTFALGAAPAQAQNAHWDPTNQDVFAESEDSMLEYDGDDDGDIDGTVSCQISEAHANTSSTGTGGNTPFGDLVDLSFGTPPDFNDCDVDPAGDVEDITVNINPPTWEGALIANTATGGGDGTVDVSIPDIAGTDVAASVETSGFLANCLIEIADDQSAASLVQNSTWVESTQTLNVDVSGLVTTVTSTGGSGCLLPSSGTSRFSGTYVRVNQGMDPNVTIQPWP